ncbi:hypothetical protein [Spirosoma sp.]|uniref:hypothetical protein n=1 Tax=Spirosoma sp. TaxID=1899569 RepID=UPI003B3AF307
MSIFLQLRRVTHRVTTLGLLAGFIACKPQTSDPVADPEPAEAISGTYQATTFTQGSSPERYPVNGQTVTLQLKRVSATSVQVDVQATANGKYSPGQNLSYPDAAITSQKASDGTITYVVTLDPSTECGYNTLYVYTQNRMDYNFIPPGSPRCSGAKIRLEKQQ